jgi:uncharacterized membrane protein YdfJ with MMPL/SSD domain
MLEIIKKNWLIILAVVILMAIGWFVFPTAKKYIKNRSSKSSNSSKSSK